MVNKRMIILSSSSLLDLLRDKKAYATIKEVYFDLDAEDYLSTGKEEDVIVEIRD